MSTREEKLILARKKLRQFQEKAKENGSRSSTVSKGSESATSSPSPKFYQQEAHASSRSESPIDPARIAWERRQTLELNEAQIKDHLLIEERNRRQSQTSVILEMSGGDVEDNRDREQELQQLREQVEMHKQAIGVIVAERTDAKNALSKVQSELQEKSDLLENIKAKYLEATNRITDLETNPPRQLVSAQNTHLEEQLMQNQESNQKLSMLQDQLTELRSRLDAKIAECESLSSKVFQLENGLSVAHVRIKQLTTEESPSLDVREKQLEEENQCLKKQVELLEKRVQAAAIDGEQAAHQFQVYADQCSSQQTVLRTQLRDLLEESRTLKEQNATLTYQSQALHSQLEQLQTQQSPREERLSHIVEENSTLTQRLLEKESEVVSLQANLSESMEKLSLLMSELETSQESIRRLEARAGSGRPDPALLAAMESDKVAASRAVAQNMKLKEQLTELQQAFVRLSDEKLALTDKLSHLEHQNGQLLSQMSHDDHQHGDGCNHDADDDDDDEEEAKWSEDELRRVVAALRRDKTELVLRLQQLTSPNSTTFSHSDIHSHHHHDHGENHHDHDHQGEKVTDEKAAEEIAELRRAVEQLQLDKAELLKRLGGPTEDPEVQGLLETKLRRTMDEIAALDEEKQRLEHLVLQLQGETETIGEYIALYHKQRLLLRQRSVEKDEQLVQLSKDREELKEKLLSLNELVTNLIGNHSRTQNDSTTSDDGMEATTAEKIQALITEIGNNNVVNAHSVAFEQCSCCSGRLITV